MSRSLRCLQCSSTFIVPSTADGTAVACPKCGATRVVAENRAAAEPKAAPVRPPLTDDDVLAFIGSPPAAKAPRG
jgi:DNA-directed RNA polymerase subunit RPC12/RpoP